MGKLPVLILDALFFWFIEAPKGLTLYFLSLNDALLKLFSFRVLLSTYFKPWKNEYRKGLVGFSIAMGMFIKGWTILFDLALLLVFIVIEIAAVLAFVLWPFATLGLFFIKI